MFEFFEKKLSNLDYFLIFTSSPPSWRDDHEIRPSRTKNHSFNNRDDTHTQKKLRFKSNLALSKAMSTFSVSPSPWQLFAGTSSLKLDASRHHRRLGHVVDTNNNFDDDVVDVFRTRYLETLCAATRCRTVLLLRLVLIFLLMVWEGYTWNWESDWISQSLVPPLLFWWDIFPLKSIWFCSDGIS